MENDKISTVPTSRLSEALGSRWFRGVLALLTFVYMFYKPTASVGGYASSALFGLCVLWIVWPRLKCLFRREAAVFKKSKSKALRNKSKKSKNNSRVLGIVFNWFLTSRVLGIVLNWLLRCLIVLHPVILFHLYVSIWFYTWNHFDEGSLGVVVAGFEEVPMSEFVAQGSFREMLKRELSDPKWACDHPLKAEFLFISRVPKDTSEAREIGRLTNAMVVLWGEVHKGYDFFEIRPQVLLANRLVLSLGRKSSQYISRLEEGKIRWNIRVDALGPDSLLIKLEDFLVLPCLALCDRSAAKSEERLEWIRCNLVRSSHLLGKDKAILAQEIAMHHFGRRDYHSSIEWYSRADSLLLCDNLDKEEASELRSVFVCNNAKCYARLNQQDSAGHYLQLAWEIDPLMILKDSVLYESLWNGIADESLAKLHGWDTHVLEHWERKKDCVLGEFLLRFSKHFGTKLPDAFLFEFDSICYGSSRK